MILSLMMNLAKMKINPNKIYQTGIVPANDGLAVIAVSGHKGWEPIVIGLNKPVAQKIYRRIVDKSIDDGVMINDNHLYGKNLSVFYEIDDIDEFVRIGSKDAFPIKMARLAHFEIEDMKFTQDENHDDIHEISFYNGRNELIDTFLTDDIDKINVVYQNGNKFYFKEKATQAMKMLNKFDENTLTEGNSMLPKRSKLNPRQTVVESIQAVKNATNDQIKKLVATMKTIIADKDFAGIDPVDAKIVTAVQNEIKFRNLEGYEDFLNGIKKENTLSRQNAKKAFDNKQPVFMRDKDGNEYEALGDEDFGDENEFDYYTEAPMGKDGYSKMISKIVDSIGSLQHLAKQDDKLDSNVIKKLNDAINLIKDSGVDKNCNENRPARSAKKESSSNEKSYDALYDLFQEHGRDTLTDFLTEMVDDGWIGDDDFESMNTDDLFDALMNAFQDDERLMNSYGYLIKSESIKRESSFDEDLYSAWEDSQTKVFRNDYPGYDDNEIELGEDGTVYVHTIGGVNPIYDAIMRYDKYTASEDPGAFYERSVKRESSKTHKPRSLAKKPTRSVKQESIKDVYTIGFAGSVIRIGDRVMDISNSGTTGLVTNINDTSVSMKLENGTTQSHKLGTVMKV